MKGVHLMLNVITFIFLGIISSYAQSGIYESYVILDDGTTTTYYDLNAFDAVLFL